MKPHALFQVWRPDEVAECLDGVPDAVYQKIWNKMVPLYDGKPRSEYNDDFSERCLARPEHWNLLTVQEKAKLNQLARDHEDELDIIRKGA